MKELLYQRQPTKETYVARGGFTLIELLVTIGIIGILAAITIIAVNPLRNLDDAYNAEMRAYMREMLNAYNQLMIDGGSLSSPVSFQGDGIEYAVKVCKIEPAALQTACLGYPLYFRVNLSALVPTYIVELPNTPHNPPDSVFTGYYWYKSGTFRQFCVPKLDDSCGSLVTP